MKKIILLIGAVALIAASCDSPASTSTTEVFYPAPTNYVVDSANVLSQATEDKLIAEFKELDSKAQIAVVTVQTTQPLTIEEYSIKLAEKWKVGYAGQDNGVILVIATQDRKVRIEVGRGLEGKINDAKAGNILDQWVIPSLKKGDWDGGVLQGADAIKKEILK